MKVIIKENGKIIREYDYTNSTSKTVINDLQNILEYIEINELPWFIEITK